MNDSVLRENLEIERLAAENAEQALVEGEVALPGGIREEATVLSCEGRLVISSVEPQTDRLATDGTVVFQVLYRQGDDTVRVLEANCAFNHVTPMQGVATRMHPQVKGTVQSATAQPVSGRMRLRAVVDVMARVFSPEQRAVVSGVTGVEELQTLRQANTLTRHAATGHASALLREEFELTAPPAITETLYAKATPHINGVSGGEGRAMVEGDVVLEVFHQGAEPNAPLVVTQHIFPFEQAVDLTGPAGDDLTARVQVQDVVASSVDVGDGVRVLRTETVLDLDVESFAEETVSSLRDAYTLSGDVLNLDVQPISCFSGINRINGTESDKLVLSMPDGSAPVGHVLATLVRPTMTGSEQMGGRTVVEGLLDTQVIYTPQSGGAAQAVRQETPFRVAFQGAIPTGASVSLTARDVQADAIAPDRVELRYKMEMDADQVQAEPVLLPMNVSTKPAPVEKSGLVMVWPQPGEGLWDIAKRQRVTTETIAKLNPGIDEAKPSKGVLILKKA